MQWIALSFFLTTETRLQQSMTLELGSIEGITLTCCAPFSFPLYVGLELEQFHQKPIK